jgi:hypothetical protein
VLPPLPVDPPRAAPATARACEPLMSALPAGFVVGAQTLVVNGVTWFTDDAAGTVRWTAVDRPVYVEADVPSGYASGPVAALSATVADALPASPIRPRR